MMTTPESHRRRREEEMRGRRHRGDREAACSLSSSSASRRRPQHSEAERDDAPRRDRAAGIGEEAPPPSPAKKPRVRSEVGLVRGCAWRFEPFRVPAAVAPPTSPSSVPAPAAADNRDGMVFAREPAPPPKGGAAAASSSSSAAPPAPTAGVLLACQLSLPPPPPPLSTHAAPQPLFFTGSASAPPPIPVPASTPCLASMKMIPPTLWKPYAAAIPAIPPFPTVAPPPEHPIPDADELRRAKVQRYAGLIAKKQEENAESYRKLLRSGQAPVPPEAAPKPEPAADRTGGGGIAAARRRFGQAMAQLERNAKEAALFVQMAPPEQLRELGIDKDMERLVSPERPRDGNGVPVVSPEHPCSPVEKLGFFLRADRVGET